MIKLFISQYIYLYIDVQEVHVSELVNYLKFADLLFYFFPKVNGNEVSLLQSNGKETLWIERNGWGKDSSGGVVAMGNGGQGDYAEVDTRGLTTFCNLRKDQPTPYATTTLLNRRRCPVGFLICFF